MASTATKIVRLRNEIKRQQEEVNELLAEYLAANVNTRTFRAMGAELGMDFSQLASFAKKRGLKKQTI